MKPLVSILIPAYNGEKWIADTIRSALGQTWPNKEVIVVDDGSKDQTLAIARQFASKGVNMVTQPNQGGAAARNKAYSLCQGDYIQWLDHDDLLDPDKISVQLNKLELLESERVLLSSSFGRFFYRPEKAKFVHTALWQDLTPLDYFFMKFAGNIYFQSSCWLVSRKLTDLAGPWWELKSPDDDGEYFCRVVAACERIHFVAQAKCYWRVGNYRSFSEARSSDDLEAIFNSTARCIAHFRSLDESKRTRLACVRFLQDRLIYFYPESKALINRMRALANDLGGDLSPPQLKWKYKLIKTFCGWQMTKRAMIYAPRIKVFALKNWEKLWLTRSAVAGKNLSGDSHRLSSDFRPPPLTTPLVSILIPAYNAAPWIADTIRSALGQTWPNKEVIVVDDGSKDQTLAIARQFSSRGVKVVAQPNQGAAAARNNAYSLCRGDYIQWLDADDLLSPDKIAKQMEVAELYPNTRVLLSAGWAYFRYRPAKAKFTPTLLWQDLSPLEWLLRKWENNLHMQTATWLASRELTEAAGSWDTRLLSDDDGDFFSRVIKASEGIRFVPEAKVFYRSAELNRLSYVGGSNKKIDALFLGMKMQIGYLRAMKDDERVRAACVRYLQNWLIVFYPNRPEIVEEAQKLAKSLGGQLHTPRLHWKYAWIQKTLGWNTTKAIQLGYNQRKIAALMNWDKLMFRLQKLTRNGSD